MPGDNMERPAYSNTMTFGNVATLIGLMITIGGGFVGYGRIAEKLEQQDRRLVAVETHAARVPLLDAQVAALQGQTKAITERLDASFGTVSERLDRINEAVAGVRTEVAVMSQRLEALTPSQRTDLRNRLAVPTALGQDDLIPLTR